MFFVELIKALNAAKVKYAIVGGYALALHGAIRGTVDIDLVISLDEVSFKGVEKVLMDLGLTPRLPVSAKEVFQFRTEYIKNRNLIAWGFQDPAKPMRQVDVIITHDLKKMGTKVVNVSGTKVVVASIESLIEMKNKSGRPQDLEDVKSLQELLKNEKD